jgi:murein DD-endopeptidase MepM/ murein hydrolase activator NlpD
MKKQLKDLHMPIETSKLFLLLVLLGLLLFTIFRFTHAETINELRNKIDNTNSSIQKLNDEIKKFQQDLDAVGLEADSLQKTLKELDLSKKKLEANIKLTENKISTKNTEIKELSNQIGDKSERIIDSKRVISQSLYNISQMNSTSEIETLLSKKSFSEIWNTSDQLNILQGSMQDKISELKNLKVNLENNKKETEKKKAELVLLQTDLKNQTKIIASTVAEKNSILKETKNTEANYKQLLATKKAQKEAFEREVLDYESALKIAIDPNSIPTTGTGILKYPIDKIRITQYFGNTDFSTKNPQIYNGHGHTGVDFAASIGTPVKATLTGVVIGIGNTDIGNCRSYGKWVMIKHANGLSTLYAHFSLINVTEGQQVYTGNVIGYSGNTGYSTGPHLHFGVYATEGVNIIKNAGSKYCSTVKIPYASLNAYLNPLSYLQ